MAGDLSVMKKPSVKLSDSAAKSSKADAHHGDKTAFEEGEEEAEKEEDPIHEMDGDEDKDKKNVD